jgi:hypothetical protein
MFEGHILKNVILNSIYRLFFKGTRAKTLHHKANILLMSYPPIKSFMCYACISRTIFSFDYYLNKMKTLVHCKEKSEMAKIPKSNQSRNPSRSYKSGK